MEGIGSFSTQKHWGNPDINKSTIWSAEEKKTPLKQGIIFMYKNCKATTCSDLDNDQSDQQRNFKFQMK